MSFETYEASHITPQYTLLEKLNAILGFLKSGKLTARYYMYEESYHAEQTRYDKQYAIGLDEDVGEGDVLLFQNRYIAVIDHLDGDYIVISGRAIDIVTSVGHNYVHRIRLRVFYGTTPLGRFYVKSTSSTSALVSPINMKAFPDKTAYEVSPYYSSTTLIDTFNIYDSTCIIIGFARGLYGRIPGTSVNSAGIMTFISLEGQVTQIMFNFTNNDGGAENRYWVKIDADEVQEI